MFEYSTSKRYRFLDSSPHGVAIRNLALLQITKWAVLLLSLGWTMYHISFADEWGMQLMVAVLFATAGLVSLCSYFGWTIPISLLGLSVALPFVCDPYTPALLFMLIPFGSIFLAAGIIADRFTCPPDKNPN